MKSIRITILALITVLAFADASAKTVSWAISPKYDKLSRYTSEIYLVENDTKYGLMTLEDKVIVEPKYDFILPFQNGYSILGTKLNGNNKIECLVDETGNVTSLKDEYYIISSTQYVSEGKLAVVNKHGKYGYIDVSGNLIVKCLFDNALPYKGGWAPVKVGKLFKYIHSNYGSNGRLLTIDFNNGDVGKASCFYNGQSVVAYNEKRAVLGINGHKIRNISQSEFDKLYLMNNSAPINEPKYGTDNRYSKCYENGLVGLKFMGEEVISSQFNAILDIYNDGLIIAEKNGKQGLLKVLDDNYTVDISSILGLKSELSIDKNDKVEKVKINITIPTGLNTVKLMVDCGNGTIQDMTSQLSTNSGSAEVSFTPLISTNAETCTINAILENDGIIVAETSNKFALSYPIKLRISPPGPDTIQANASDIAVFSSTVYNDSNKSVEVTAKWSTGGQETRTIPAHGKSVFSSSIRVNENHTRTVSITLSTGESNSRSIYFKTFF